MPELPEVEVARRAVEEHCLHKKIVKAIIADDTKVVDGVSPSEFEASLVSKTIVGAHRKGKNMWLELDSPPFPSFQFGMTGAIYIKGVAVTNYKRSAVNDADEWPSKYSKFFVELEDGLQLSFTDKRRLARVRLLKDPTAVPPVSELGPDALLEPMTVDEFTESLSKKKTAIKALLLDQSCISGIGNWIADEVLYQARIHPQQNASSLSKESCATLHKCIKEVIDTAVEVGADTSQFPLNWIFHSREKKPGKAFVDGKKIDFITSGGRTTAYVPELQKLTGVQAAKAEGNPTKRKQRNKDKDGEDSAGEEENIAQNPKSKKGLKPRGQRKNPPAKGKSKGSEDKGDDSDDNNDGEADDETTAAKSKKNSKPRGQGKKTPVKTKAKGSDDEDAGDRSDSDDDGDADEEAKVKSKKRLTRGQGKKPPVKRKSEDSDDDGDGADDNGEPGAEDEGWKKKTGKVTNNNKGKAEMVSKKKTQTSENSKKPRKNAK